MLCTGTCRTWRCYAVGTPRTERSGIRPFIGCCHAAKTLRGSSADLQVRSSRSHGEMDRMASPYRKGAYRKKRGAAWRSRPRPFHASGARRVCAPRTGSNRFRKQPRQEEAASERRGLPAHLARSPMSWKCDLLRKRRRGSDRGGPTNQECPVAKTTTGHAEPSPTGNVCPSWESHPIPAMQRREAGIRRSRKDDSGETMSEIVAPATYFAPVIFTRSEPSSFTRNRPSSVTSTA